MNRRCEGLLRNAELLSSLSSVQSGDFVYPHEELTRLWKLVLLNQFHDVLPGTSIQQVGPESIYRYTSSLACKSKGRRVAVHYTTTAPRQLHWVYYTCTNFDGTHRSGFGHMYTCRIRFFVNFKNSGTTTLSRI